MKLTFETIAGVLVVSVHGTMNSTTSGALLEALIGQTKKGYRRIVVDVSGLTELTRAGVRGLVVTAKLLHAARGELRICGATESVGAVLQGLGLDHVVKCDPTRDASLENLERRSAFGPPTRTRKDRTQTRPDGESQGVRRVVFAPAPPVDRAASRGAPR